MGRVRPSHATGRDLGPTDCNKNNNKINNNNKKTPKKPKRNGEILGNGLIPSGRCFFWRHTKGKTGKKMAETSISTWKNSISSWTYSLGRNTWQGGSWRRANQPGAQTLAQNQKKNSKKNPKHTHTHTHTKLGSQESPENRRSHVQILPFRTKKKETKDDAIDSVFVTAGITMELDDRIRFINAN